MPYVRVGQENSAEIVVHYEDHGWGVPVVLSHGYPLTGQAWEKQVPALLAAGHRTLRTTRVAGRPRGMFCGIGACWDCLVVHNGTPGVRACLQPVADGDRVERQHGAGPAR